MILNELMRIVDAYAPIELALSNDNSGLNIGDKDANVTGVVLTVDVTIECIDMAIADGANVIISHHPILFDPISNILVGDMVSDIITHAIRNNINLYSVHTNMDNAPKGINYSLAKLLGGAGVRKLYDDGSGVVTDIQSIQLSELYCKITNFIDSSARCYGTDKIVKRIAIISGNGGRDADLPQLCEKNGVDVYISAEFKHNLINEFNYHNVSVIECDHYRSEKIFIAIMQKILKNEKTIKITEYHSELFSK